MTEPVRWPLVVEVKVPWRDVDGAGHVNNAVYFSYMETARIEAYMAATGARNPREVEMILAHTSCDFLSPAFMGETLVVRVRPTRVGQTSFALGYEIVEKATGRAVARGESVQVMYDYAKGEKKPVPPGLREALETGLASG